MAIGFDTVLTSSDLSLERVLRAGLPVAMIFYERELPPDIQQTLDDLASVTPVGLCSSGWHALTRRRPSLAMVSLSSRQS
jgi:hypothetical protein